MVECSVIIVNYNTFSLTVDCIQSIKQKVKAVSCEVIVIDNASLECNPQKFKELFPAIVLIANKENLGFSRANNQGIEKAEGKFILLLNSDTVMLNDALGESIKIMNGDQRIGVLSGQLQFPDGVLQAVAGRFPTVLRQVAELFRVTRFYRGEKRARYYLGDLWNYEKPVEADWVWGAFFMFRKSDLVHFPNQQLHDHFFMYYEDVQWCYHFRKVLGKRILYHPAPKLIHYMGKSDPMSTDFEKKYFAKILPNEWRWMRLERGRLYTRIFYLIKSLYYFTLRRQSDIAKARVFVKMAFQ